MSVDIKPASHRSCTNIPWLVTMCLIIGTAITLVIVCAVKSTDELSKVKDSCGYTCGVLNIAKSQECGDPDKRNFPKLLAKDDNKSECVAKCPDNYRDSLNTCSDDSKNGEGLQNYVNAFKDGWIEILSIAAIAFILSYVVLLLFRYCATYVIWIVCILFILGIFIVAGLVFLFAQAKAQSLIFVIGGLVATGILIWLRKRITMISKVYKEASKVLFAVPLLLCQPILTLILHMIVIGIFIGFCIVILNAGHNYALIIPAFIFNLLTVVWLYIFIRGCQSFIIGSTICHWFFTRNKNTLESPITKSYSNLLRFHLGSVAVGSLGVHAFCCTCCNYYFRYIIKDLVEFIANNAYVIVAKDGTPYLESTRVSGELFLRHIVDSTALNKIGDYALKVCRGLIVFTSAFVAIVLISGSSSSSFLDSFSSPSFKIGFGYALVIADNFVSVFEMVVDAIYICFCIDWEFNDGVSRPYFMSDELRFVMMELSGKGRDAVPMIQYGQQPPYQQQEKDIGPYPVHTTQPYPTMQHYPQQYGAPPQQYPSASYSPVPQNYPVGQNSAPSKSSMLGLLGKGLKMRF